MYVLRSARSGTDGRGRVFTFLFRTAGLSRGLKDIRADAGEVGHLIESKDGLLCSQLIVLLL